MLDNEFHEFLQALDGQQKLKEVLELNPNWKQAQSFILKTLKRFYKLSIVENTDAKTQTATKKTKFVPIENISVNITNMCNLRCKFCFNLHDLANKKENEITADEIISVVEKARKFISKQATLAILGGEPFLTPEKLFKVAKYGISKRLGTQVSSNGILITKELAEQAKTIKLKVQVSIDGHNAKLNDVVRGKGTFNKIIKGIETLVNAGVFTTISMVAHLDNYKYLEEFYDLALKLGVQEARFIPLKMLGGALNEQFKPVLNQDLMQEAYRIFKKRPEFFKLIGKDAFSILGNSCRLSSKRQSCGTGLQTFLLDADGIIYPCLNSKFPEFKIANIRDEGFDFIKIWENSKMLENYRKLTTIDVAENSCSKCFAHYWCLGGCKGETFVTTGKLNKRAYNCSDLRKSIVDMFWILSERGDLVKPVRHIC